MSKHSKQKRHATKRDHHRDDTRIKDGDKDWETPCQNCGELPTVHPLALCGLCCWGESETAGGNW